MCMPEPMKVRRGRQIPWNWSCRCIWTTLRMLQEQLSALNCELSLHPPTVYHIFETDFLTRTLPIMLDWLAGEPWRSNFLHLPSAKMTEIHQAQLLTRMLESRLLSLRLHGNPFAWPIPRALGPSFSHSFGWFFTSLVRGTLDSILSAPIIPQTLSSRPLTSAQFPFYLL